MAEPRGTSPETGASGSRVPGSRVVGLDHVQLAMPFGEEARADAFYAGVLGFEVLEKPPVLAARGGRWYGAGDTQLHLGVDADFRPAEKAHPALLIDDLDELVEQLHGAGLDAVWDDNLPGARRCYVHDPFGNRIELIAST